MDQLIIKSLQGATTPAEEEWLRRWRAEAPPNDQRYRQAKRLWELTSVADPSGWDQSPPDVDLVVRQAEDEKRVRPGRDGNLAPALATDPPRAGVPVAGTVDERRRRWWLNRVALGALAASLVAVGFGLAGMGTREDTSGPFSDGEVVTGAGELTTVTLRDGSSIRIGPSSRLSLTQDEDGIVAHLAGRAFFAVHANPSRRFRVTTDRGAATVFGTRFEVRSDEGEFRVMVVDGKVRVSSSEGTAVDLVKSEMSVSDGDGPPTKTTVADVYEELTWMGNALVFQGTPLEEAAREIGRYFGVDVVLEAPELSETTVSVTFTDEELDDVISVVCEIVGALCLIDNERVRILRDVPATRVQTG